MRRRWVKRFFPGRDDGSRRADDDQPRTASTGPANNQYTRSRTISAYAPAMSPDLNRLSAHQLRSHRRRLLQILAVCAAAALVLGIVASQLTAHIGAVSYSPATVSNPDDTAIKQAADEYYASRPLERLRFLLDEATLGQYIASKVPEVTGVQSVGGDGIGGTRLALSMRMPVASWKIGDKVVYVDSSGASFTHNYYGPPSVEVDDQSGADTASGSSAIASSSMIRYIGQLIAALQANGTGTVDRVVLPAGMIRELDVYLQGRGYRVKVQLDRDVAAQAEDVKTALIYIDSHGGAAEYVDARVAGKAFYK